MNALLKKMSPPRIIALGFLALILLGSVLLFLPFSVKDGIQIKYIDALYTSVSAVCVTGLVTLDPGDTFSIFGQAVIAVLIQLGGLGVTSVGAGVIVAMHKKMGLKGMNLVKEGSNLGSSSGIIPFLKNVFLTTLTIEVLGAALSFIRLIGQYPFPKAVWLSVFHSVASFNNAGFDVFGGGQSLIPYRDDLYFNIVTALLIFLGGIGFLVIRELINKRFNFKKLSMHAKVVLSVSLALTLGGALLFKVSGNMSWLEAFFSSVTARTAGFSTYSASDYSNAGLLIMLTLMFIGASPGSTGGGVKTSTFYVIYKGILSSATNKSEKAFKYSIPKHAFKKAAVICAMGIGIILIGCFVFSLLEPNIGFGDVVFEMTSAFGTVGLSRGVTGIIGSGAKILSMFIMFIGRLGPLTIATLWYFDKGERVKYPDGNLAIG